MVVVSHLFVLAVLFMGQSALAAPEKITKDLRKYSQKMSVLKKEISLLKRRLGNTNKRYLTVMKRRKHIDELLYTQKSNLKKNLLEIKRRQGRFSNSLRSLVLQTIDSPPQRPGDMAHQKILVNSLEQELKKLHKNKKINKKLSQEIARLDQKYKEYIDIEQGILNLMEDWESSKKEKSKRYRSHIRMVNTIKQNRPPPQTFPRNRPLFQTPIGKYQDIQHGHKGVTYRFQGRQKVLNSYPGKIVYSGQLSTYGNVLMIDHGQDLRSIILGGFTPKYQKGVRVKKGDIIGYTNAVKDRLGKIYFEIRKRNKAQNTMNFLDKSSLTKTKATKTAYTQT